MPRDQFELHPERDDDVIDLHEYLHRRLADALPASTSETETDPLTRRNHILEELPGLRAGGVQRMPLQKGQIPFDLPLVVRRELYLGRDQWTYRHVDFWALYFVRRGRGTHIINGQPFGMARGNVYFMAPGSVHSYHGSHDLVLDAFYIGETLFFEEERRALEKLSGQETLFRSVRNDRSPFAGGHYTHLSPERQIQAEEAIAHIRRELVTREPALWMSARARLWCLVVQLALWRGQNPGTVSGGTSMEIADVLRYCEANFSKPLSVEQLASLAHFSRNHFTRIFTEQVGMAPAVYVRYLRLQHGQKLLRTTNYPVADVAQLCGFSDETTFGRAFRKAFGITPTSYRTTKKRTRLRKVKPSGSVQSAS